MAIAVYPGTVATGDTGHAALHNAVDADLAAHKSLKHPQVLSDLIPALATATPGLVLTTTGVAGGVALSPVVTTGSGGSTGVLTTEPPASATIFEGTVTANAIFDAGFMAPTATVVVTIAVTAVTAPAGTATVINWYVRGPATNWLLSAAPVAVTTLSVPFAGVAAAHVAITTGLAIPLQQFDALVPKVASVGTQPAANISAAIYFDPLAVVPIPCPAPTGIIASVAGQADGAALVQWTAPTVPTGQTGTLYTVTSSTGISQNVAFGTNSIVMTGLTSTSMTFRVAATTSSLVGLSSVPSNAVTPTTTILTGRLTTREKQGQDWIYSTGPGSAAYDSSTTPTGAVGLTGSLKLSATGAGSVEANLVTAKPVVAGETGKAVSAIVQNNSGAAVLFAIWVAFLDGTGAYTGSTPVVQVSIGAGATATYNMSEDAPGTAATALLACQMIANGGGDNVNISAFSWAS